MTKTCNKYILLCLYSLLILFSKYATAQISFGGTPPSFSLLKEKSIARINPKIIAPQDDILLLKRQDKIAKKNGLPPIIATLIPTQLNLEKDGLWERIKGDSVCRLSVSAPSAQGIILYYDQFKIPAGGKLYIYNNDKSQLLGAYTNETNPNEGSFSTEIVYGDNLTLEYIHPSGQDKPTIAISRIGYCYNLNETDLKKSGFQAPAKSNCYVDVNCSPEGDNWRQQKKGIAKLLVPIGGYTYLCSGSLVNNVYQDQTPYFLSAHHCFFQDGKTADFSAVIFYFHHESEMCGQNVPSRKEKTIVGAELLVNIPLRGGSDGALLKLKTPIPDSYDVYYNGWDISTTPPTKGVAIHHPGGDLKKISTYMNPPSSTTVTDLGDVGASNAHWNVVYSQTTNGYSATEEGSSGSPLFNQNGRIVGTLTGGESSCDTPSDPDYYGKFYYHWNKVANPNQQMAKYLNPQNYPLTGINGIALRGDTLKNGDLLTISPVIFGNYLYINTTYVVNSIEVYSVSGKLMTRTNTSPVNTQSWPRGVYIITVNTSGGKGKAKVLKK